MEQDSMDGIITRIITKIRSKKNRPCFQNILELVKRGGKEMDYDTLKEIITGMVDRNIVEDKGKEGCESFYVVMKDKLDESIDENEGLGDFHDKEIEHLVDDEHLTNEQFNDILINRIKSEVKNALIESKVYVDNTINNDASLHKPIIDRYDTLIDTLKSEISFLRNAVASKNKIIELLISDNKVHNNPLEVNHFDDLKNKHNDSLTKTTKTRRDKHSFNNTNTYNSGNSFNKNPNLNLHNRFNSLAEDKDIVNDDFQDTENDQHNMGVVNQRKRAKYRSINILGDSIIKDIKQHKMKESLQKGERIYVKSFSGATTDCMKDYIKPSLRFKPELIILHTGSNDLRSETSEERIAENIIELAINSKSAENEIVISGILPRNDKLNEKGQKVNICLKRLCVENNIVFISNDFIEPSKHLNGSGLHLNFQGTVALASNFLNFIKY